MQLKSRPGGGEDREQLMRLLAESGYDMIVAGGLHVYGACG